MIDLWPLFSTGCEALVSYLASVAAKSTVLLLTAFSLDCLLGRRRVLVRSSLWNATLAALSVLPLATWLLPAVSIAVPTDSRQPVVAGRDNVSLVPATTPTAVSPNDGTLLDGATPTQALSAGESIASMDWGAVAVWGSMGVYLSVCAALVVRFARSLRAVAALTAAAEPVADERWNTLLADLRERLGVVRPVRLLVSPEVAVPVQVGWLRPGIFLPASVSASTDETTRAAVLVHELGHVRRGDYGWNLLLRALSIVYWPHPLVWLLGRQIGQLREQACDELCIHWLGGQTAYRARLIELAAGLLSHRPIASLGIAMSQPTKLAQRLAWIEASSGRPQCLASPLARRSFVAVMVLVASLLGAATAAPSVARAQVADDEEAKDQKPSEAAPDAGKTPPVAADETDDNAPATGDSVVITVVEAGKGHAEVYLADGKVGQPLSGTPAEQDAQIKQAVEKGLAGGKPIVLIKAEKGVSYRDVSRIAAAASAVEGIKLHLAVLESKEKEENEAKSGRVRVLVERVKRQDLTIETAQQCILSAGRTSAVYARVPGFVKRIDVEIGDHVKKGQALAELESLELGPEVALAESLVAESEAEQQQAAVGVLEAKANLAAAKAAVEKAEGEVQASAAKLTYQEKVYARVKNLAEKNAVDEAMVDEQEEKLAAAKAAVKGATSGIESAKALVRQREAAVASTEASSKLAAARVRVAQAKLAEVKHRSESVRLVSPMDGVLVERNTHVGDFVGSPVKNSPIFTVADLRRMSTAALVPEREALAIRRGDAARIFIDALPGKVFTAKVSRVAYNIGPNRTLRVDLDLDADNADGRLLPGMSAVAAIALAVHRDVLSIPAAAPGYGGQVMAVVDGRAVEKPIETEDGSYGRLEVLSGLKEGDVVITALANPKQKQPDWRRQVVRVEIVEEAEDKPGK